MSEKSNVFKEAIKFKGFWNYLEVYKFCFNWLKEEDYLVSEDTYTEKISSSGKEIEIKWTAKKKISDYYRNIIEVKWHILYMEDADVEVNGKKQRTNKGEVKITVSADLERDYEARWEDRPTWKFLRGVYDKYVVRTTTDDYEFRLENKANEYTEEIKAFLNLEGKQ